MILVRQYDIRRFWQSKIEELPIINYDGTVTRTPWGCYTLDIKNSEGGTTPTHNFARLVAKDFVPPFSQGSTIRTLEVPQEDLPEFVIKRDKNGVIIKKKPEPRDIPLPVVFFKPAVLKKYYNDPERYSVGFHMKTFGGISFLDQWSLSLGRNDEGYIQVFLGDIVKKHLPLEEVLHWRSFNILPHGVVGYDFWDTQAIGNMPKKENISLESQLKDVRDKMGEKIKGFGKELYKPYSGIDKYLENLLRIPLYNDPLELNDCVLILTKIFVEYLNNDLFSQELPESLLIDSVTGQKFRSIIQFTNWLKHCLSVTETIAHGVKKSLQNIQMVRSGLGGAHRFSDSSYRKIINKLGIQDPITSIKIFKTIAEPLVDSFKDLIAVL